MEDQTEVMRSAAKSNSSPIIDEVITSSPIIGASENNLALSGLRPCGVVDTPEGRAVL